MPKLDPSDFEVGDTVEIEGFMAPLIDAPLVLRCTDVRNDGSAEFDATLEDVSLGSFWLGLMGIFRAV